MHSALIGYTGFVGGNLLQQRHFDNLYNSKNIADIHGQHFNMMVVAAAPAVKWYANQHPQEDKQRIDALINDLKQVRANSVILISTIDVYPHPIEVDETTAINIEECQPYGKHRLQLETFMRNHFSTRVMRLPGLFGSGLKKNVIYDYLHNNQIEKIDTRNRFQFYNLQHLNRDIEKLLRTNIELLNLAVEPVDTATIAQLCTGKKIHNSVLDKPITYDFRSIYAKELGCSAIPADGYLYSQAHMLQDLQIYLNSLRSLA